jgi:transcriptional regulator with XRE-family HTH domain
MLVMSLAGEVIHEARSRAGLSLRELARRSATSPATLTRYERGLIHPGMQTVERIVAACGYEMRITLTEPDPGQDLAGAAIRSLTPSQRLATLRAWSELRGAAGR